MESAVCSEHKSQIDQGARWLYQPAEASGGRLLMGRDLPPRAVGAGSKPLLSSEGRVSRFTFVVEKYDGSQSEVVLEMSPDVADCVWQVLNRGRGEVSNSSSGS
jgi:hypothetical protein